jgi:hypothetical protein
MSSLDKGMKFMPPTPLLRQGSGVQINGGIRVPSGRPKKMHK